MSVNSEISNITLLDTDGSTQYRIIPNIELGGDDFSDGCTLQWKEHTEEDWHACFLVAPHMMRAVADMLFAAAAAADNTTQNFWPEFLAVDENGHCAYKVVPCTTVGLVDYSAGATLQWADDANGPWQGDFSVSRDSLKRVAGAIKTASEGE